MLLLLPLLCFCIPVLCLMCYPVINVLYLVSVYFVRFWFNFMYFMFPCSLSARYLSPQALILTPMWVLVVSLLFPFYHQVRFFPLWKKNRKGRGFSSNLMFTILAKGCRNSIHSFAQTLWPVSPIYSRVGSRCTNVNALFTAKLTQLSYLC